jgi:hypothetical protein
VVDQVGCADTGLDPRLFVCDRGEQRWRGEKSCEHNLVVREHWEVLAESRASEGTIVDNDGDVGALLVFAHLVGVDSKGVGQQAEDDQPTPRDWYEVSGRDDVFAQHIEQPRCEGVNVCDDLVVVNDPYAIGQIVEESAGGA